MSTVDWRLGPALLLSVLALAIVVSNAIVIFTIFRSKNRRRLRTTTNILIANLASTDLIVGLFSIPVMLLEIFGLPEKALICYLMHLVSYIPIKVSVFGYLALSVDRYIAVMYPFKYISLCKTRTAIKINGLSWLLAVGVMAIPLYRVNDVRNSDLRCSMKSSMTPEVIVYGSFLVINLPFSVAIVTMLILIFRGVRQTLWSKNKGPYLRRSHSVVETCHRLEIRAAIKCSLLVCIFIICQLPFHITAAVELWAGIGCQPCLGVSLCLLLANSVVNPFLYSWTNRDLKQAMKMTICSVVRGGVRRNKKLTYSDQLTQLEQETPPQGTTSPPD